MTMTTTTRAGLFAQQGAAIPLRGVEIAGEVLGGHSRTTVRQRYENVEASPVEAIYTFPLPSDATLVSFVMTCAGRRIEGVVKEREQAFKEYDDAVVAGHGAALVEQERPNVFTANVGNLLPKEETVVELEYVQRLAADEGSLRLMIPTLVAPRYIPGDAQGERTAHGWAEPTSRVPDADRITPPLARDIPYGLRLALEVDLGRDVEIASPSHAITVDKLGGKLLVRFTQDEVALDRDVIVAISNIAADEPLATVVVHDGANDARDGSDSGAKEPGAFALTVVPDLLGSAGAGTTPQSVVFVIDTSGSMGGLSIEQARAALRLCLRHLREGDTFNIIEFNTRHSSFASSAVPFTQKTLSEADAWVSRLHATGGTEILEPLVAAIRQVPQGLVVLLTDGEVGNEDEVVKAALAARAHTRVYSFGIGTNVSDAMLRELAKQTGGAIELIYPGERIDEKVVGVFARAVAPRVTDVEVEWTGLAVADVVPAKPYPDLVDGEPWVLLGRLEGGGGAGTCAGTCAIRGRRDGKPFGLRVPVLLRDAASHPAIVKLWAAERIRELESWSLAGRRADRMRERIVELSTKYGVASRYTAFIAVETRTGDRLASGQPETRVVPVNVPFGWGMFAQAQADGRRASPGGAAKTLAGGMPAFLARMPSPAAPPPAPAAIRPAAMHMGDEITGASMTAPRAKSGGVLSSLGSSIGSMLDGAADLFRSKSAEKAKPEATGAGSTPQELAGRAPAQPPAPAMNAGPGAPATSDAAEVEALLAQQLASGLWSEAGSDPADEMALTRATTRALARLVATGITSAHPLHGGQVKKAVEALLAMATRVAARDAKVAELALAACWLAASGRRTRKEVETAVHATPGCSGLADSLGEDAKVRALLSQDS